MESSKYDRYQGAYDFDYYNCKIQRNCKGIF